MAALSSEGPQASINRTLIFPVYTAQKNCGNGVGKVMSFGRRDYSRDIDVSSSVVNWRIWCSGGLLIAALIAGVIGYGYRVRLVRSLAPQHLANLTVNGAQLDGKWSEVASNPRIGSQVINWTLTEMAKLCEDGRTLGKRLEHTKNIQKLGLAIDDIQSSENLYGSDRRSAKAAIGDLKQKRAQFCAEEYFVAVYDGTVAENRYLTASISLDHEVLDWVARARDNSISYLNKMKSAGRVLLDTELTNDERNVRDCGEEAAGNGDQMLLCFVEKSAGANSAAVQRFMLARKSAPVKPTLIGQSETVKRGYESPAIDIRERCASVHRSNYEYREICERNQREARSAIASMDVPTEIQRHCDGVHSDNYEYRKICYTKQMKSKDENGY